MIRPAVNSEIYYLSKLLGLDDWVQLANRALLQPKLMDDSLNFSSVMFVPPLSLRDRDVPVL